MGGGGGQFLYFMGGHSCHEGGIGLMEGVPHSPPTRENPGHWVNEIPWRVLWWKLWHERAGFCPLKTKVSCIDAQ